MVMEKHSKSGKYYKFLVYVIVVALVNIAGITLYFRSDLTSNKVYSLSAASCEAVSSLSEPLTVKAFFTKKLPAPYNGIERYLHDLLEEYSLEGNRYFNFEFYEIAGENGDEKNENQKLAKSYGIYPVQIQNIEEDEVKFQTAYMGLVLIHGDLVETIPTLTSTEGLEYKLTSIIRKMNNKISALINLEKDINVRLFLSSSLKVVGPYLNLSGLSKISGEVEEMVEKLNVQNYGRLKFSNLDTSGNPEFEKQATKYNVLELEWEEFRDRKKRKIPAGKGYAGIVVEYGDKFEVIQIINVFRIPLFGTQYQLADLEDLEQNINGIVDNLINVNEEIGYLTDHDTVPLSSGANAFAGGDASSISNFKNLLAKDYSIREVNLEEEEDIPEAISTLVIAGAKKQFSEYELYKIDQYLMKGRNLVIFQDAFNEVVPNRDQNMFGQRPRPVYLPVKTGLEKLLAHYGINLEQSYVLDKSSFKQKLPQAFGGGEQKIYYAPIVKNEFINKDVKFLRDIKGLILIKTAGINVNEKKLKEKGLKAIKLFSSSKKSWEMSGRVELNPLYLEPPQDKKEFKQIPLAYVVEGEFSSYFADKPVPLKEVDEDKVKSDKSRKEKVRKEIKSQKTTLGKGKPGKIFIVGTSEILKNNIIDKDGDGPNAQFLMNTFDYINGREENALMRSKAQKFNPLREISAGSRTLIKTINIAGLPLLVILAGIVIWIRRMSRKKTIRRIFT